MNRSLRPANASDAASISALVCASFNKHIAHDWEPEGQRHFLEENQASKLCEKISSACLCLVCEQSGQLNSSPYAVDAYRALGFFPISHAYKRDGAVATRMACWLPGRRLERAHGA
jgi:hypothetical protein